MKLSSIIITCITLNLCYSAIAKSSIDSPKKEIEAIVEAFRISIINKDRETFTSLFYSNDIPFIAVFSDAMLQQKRAQKPNYPHSVNFAHFGSPVDMISDEKEQEEKIWNIEISTDGYLGSVHFEYSNHVNGKKLAWGTEAWSLVKIDSAWKIISVSYTVTENPSFQSSDH